jgi:hypothetical protein
VGIGWLKERCGLESQTNFFPFKRPPKTGCVLDSRIYGILKNKNKLCPYKKLSMFYNSYLKTFGLHLVDIKFQDSTVHLMWQP